MKILYIAYFFPPLGGGGVQRTVKFVKYLHRLGVSITVLTVHEDTPYKHDSSLAQDIPADVTIVRTPAPGWDWLNRIGTRFHFSPLTAFAIKLLTVPDQFLGWRAHAVKAAKKELAKDGYDAIVTTSSPFTAHLIGRELKRAFPHIAWIADFRDEWSSNPWTHYPTPLHAWLNRRLERATVRECDHLVSVTHGITKDFLIRAGMPSSHGTTISNGFDAEDFPLEKIPPKTDRLTITYAGSLYGELNPRVFFEGVRILHKQHPEYFGLLKLRFAGGGAKNLRSVFRLHETWWEEILETSDYMPHADVLPWMRAASLLLLLVPTSRGPNATSGKIFEYLAAGVPILALVGPDSEAAKIIHDTNTGVVVPPEDPLAIASMLANLFTLWHNQHSLDYQPNKDEVHAFDRKHLTDMFFETLKRVVEQMPTDHATTNDKG